MTHRLPSSVSLVGVALLFLFLFCFVSFAVGTAAAAEQSDTPPAPTVSAWKDTIGAAVREVATQGVGEKFFVKLELTNTAQHTLSGAKAVIKGGAYFGRDQERDIPSIKSGDTHIMEIQLIPIIKNPKQHHAADDQGSTGVHTLRDDVLSKAVATLPSRLVFVLRDDQGLDFHQFTHTLPIGSYVHQEIKLMCPNETRVLLVGGQGACKSSVINAVFHVVETHTAPKAVRQKAICCQGGKETTTVVGEYLIPGTPITLIDTPGIGLSRFNTTEQMEILLQGTYKPEWNMTMVDRGSEDTWVNKTPHVVLYMLPYSVLTPDELNKADNPLIKEIESFQKLANNHRIPFLFVITQLDNVVGALREDGLANVTTVDEYYRVLREKAKVAPFRITHTIVYYKFIDSSNPNIDKMSYLLLSKTLQQVDTCVPRPAPPPPASMPLCWSHLVFYPFILTLLGLAVRFIFPDQKSIMGAILTIIIGVMFYQFSVHSLLQQVCNRSGYQ